MAAALRQAQHERIWDPTGAMNGHPFLVKTSGAAVHFADLAAFAVISLKEPHHRERLLLFSGLGKLALSPWKAKLFLDRYAAEI